MFRKRCHVNIDSFVDICSDFEYIASKVTFFKFSQVKAKC